MTAISEMSAINYLKPLPDTFWSWSDGCDELCWKEGSLIVFRSELEAVLSELAPDGLPSFGALLLVLAATRNSWNSTQRTADTLLYELLPDLEERSTDRYTPVLDRVLTELTRVSKLPEELRANAAGKTVIAQIVFPPQERSLPAAEAKQVVELLRPGLDGLLNNVEDGSSFGYAAKRTVEDLTLLSKRLPYVTADAIRHWTQTSLDGLPRPLDVDELPVPEVARRLMTELQNDLEWAGLARVARRLIAATSIPRPLTFDDEQDAGGLSDISNRGPYDRLLLSELANDGLTLAIRVAMNEALYLRRETPPGPPRVNRAILVDSGLRSWGLPRLYSTALALAFTAATDPRCPVTVVRPSGDRLIEVDFTTREGLLDHLGALETDLSFHDALEPLVKQSERSELPLEPILIFPEELLADSEFDAKCRTVFSDMDDVTDVILATTNRQGQITITKRTQVGEQRLRQLTVRPEEILARGDELVDRAQRRDQLPAIFAQETFPLLLSHHVRPEQTWYIEGFGVHSLTNDGRLMRWTEAGEGAYQVSDQMPPGKLLWASAAPVDGQISAVIGGENEAFLVHIGQSNFYVEMHSIGSPMIGTHGEFASHGGVLLQINLPTRCVIVRSLEDGSEIDRIDLPSQVSWHRDRFFIDAAGAYFAIAYDGQNVKFELLSVAPSSGTGHASQFANWVCVFEQSGFDGPFVVVNDATILNLATGETSKLEYVGLSHIDQCPFISHDGVCIVVHGDSRWPGHYQLNGTLNKHKWRSRFPDSRANEIVQERSVRHKFSAVGISEGGELILVGRNGNRARIGSEGGRICLWGKTDIVEIDAKGFRDLEYPSARYQLSEAQFSSGTRAVLDSRGLLHLQPAAESLTEVTLVLVDGELAGWCADGRLWGRRYYSGPTGDTQFGSVRDIWETVLRPILEGFRD